MAKRDVLGTLAATGSMKTLFSISRQMACLRPDGPTISMTSISFGRFEKLCLKLFLMFDTRNFPDLQVGSFPSSHSFVYFTVSLQKPAIFASVFVEIR